MTGSTWVNEILLLIKLDVDEEKWKSIPRFERFPYIEMDPPMVSPGHTYEKLDNAPSPRLVKSHLPVKFFLRHLHEDGPRIVVPMRNPKSTLVSLYHFYRANRALGCFTGEKVGYQDIKNEYKPRYYKKSALFEITLSTTKKR